eukprot:8913552-Karenia_brevis.AAC.1
MRTARSNRPFPEADAPIQYRPHSAAANLVCWDSVSQLSTSGWDEIVDDAAHTPSLSCSRYKLIYAPASIFV